MKTIVAPVDFSNVSFNAARYAAKMAADIHAELYLFHVTEIPVSIAEFPVNDSLFEEINMDKEMNALKNELLKEADGKITIQTKNIIGSVEYELKHFCNEKKPFAVVMSSHSSALLDKFFIGSITVYAVSHLNCPVIIVPPGQLYKPIKKIAFATDLKDIYDVPVNEIRDIIKAFNTSLDIIHVYKTEQEKNKCSLSGLLLDHRLQQFNPRLYYILHSNILKGVCETALSKSIDMILIISRKHALFHHSQSREFVFQSSLPVIAIHENDSLNKEEHDKNHPNAVNAS